MKKKELNKGLGQVPRRRRGAALLEVVVALGILLVCMSIIGMAFRNGLYHVDHSEQKLRAMRMTERLLAELDTNLLDLEEREQTGWFYDPEYGIHEALPEMSWRVEVQPSDRIEGLVEVDISIYMGDPDGSEDARNLVLKTRALRPEPRGLDFERDFGLDEDQIAQFSEAIPGGAQLFDPNNFDPRELAQLDLDTLMEILPTLIQAFGANLNQGQLNQLIQALESGDLSQLQQAAGRGGFGQGPEGRAEGDDQAAGGSTGGRRPRSGAQKDEPR